MTAISELQKVLDNILKLKKGFTSANAVTLTYDLDNVVMSQKLPISASMDVSKASERLKEVRILINKKAPKKDIDILLDDAVSLIQKAISESVGRGRGKSPDSN